MTLNNVEFEYIFCNFSNCITCKLEAVGFSCQRYAFGVDRWIRRTLTGRQESNAQIHLVRKKGIAVFRMWLGHLKRMVEYI